MCVSTFLKTEAESLGTSAVVIVSLWPCRLQCACIYFQTAVSVSDSHGYFIYNTTNKIRKNISELYTVFMPSIF